MNTKANLVRDVLAKVRKGDVRNTVLRSVHALEGLLEGLRQGKSIKDGEIADADADKAAHLRRQSKILGHGMSLLAKAMETLSEYKDTVSQD
jgi:hypothetical protein